MPKDPYVKGIDDLYEAARLRSSKERKKMTKFSLGQKVLFHEKTLEPPEPVEICGVNEDGTYNVFVTFNGIRYTYDDVPYAKLSIDKEEYTHGLFASMIQDVNISTTLGKEDIFELGKRKPYYRYAGLPASGVMPPINAVAGSGILPWIND